MSHPGSECSGGDLWAVATTCCGLFVPLAVATQVFLYQGNVLRNGSSVAIPLLQVSSVLGVFGLHGCPFAWLLTCRELGALRLGAVVVKDAVVVT